VGRHTPLFKLHQELGARVVDFGGWDMPVQYSSQIGEHHAVRRAAGGRSACNDATHHHQIAAAAARRHPQKNSRP